MTLDKTFVSDIRRTANGDGSREYRFSFLKSAREARKKMSTPDIMNRFSDIVKEYGRATVGICVAVTVWERRDRLKLKTVNWAKAVLETWTNRPASIDSLYISDNLHPTRIEEYAGSLIKFTTKD